LVILGFDLTEASFRYQFDIRGYKKKLRISFYTSIEISNLNI